MRDKAKDTSHFQSSSTSRRSFLRGAMAAGIALPFSRVAMAQSGAGSGSALPSYYPGNYQSIVDASKKETELTIYSNVATYNWQPIIQGFQKRFPWIKNIKTNNLDSSEVHERFFSESATGTSPASLLVTASPTSWYTYSERNAGLDYRSPELDHLPKDLSEPLPNIFTFSTDPIMMGYNTALLSKDEQPKSMGQLAKMVSGDPKRFNGKISTYDVAVSFGFAIFYNWLKIKGDAGWDILATLLKVTRPERSSGPIVNKLLTGEYLAGYFMSSTVILPQVKKSAGLLGWSYISDGTPMFMRGMSIPKTAPQVNSAKLMLDYLLSEAGQVEIFEGGFTPYRADLPKVVTRSYPLLVSELGKKNLITVGYNKISRDEEDALIKKWKSLLK